MKGKGTLYARAYTKSGSVEKYEGGLTCSDAFQIPGNGNYGDCYYPSDNGDGNYYIVWNGPLPWSCTTEYKGVVCTFSWTVDDITSSQISITGPTINFDDYDSVGTTKTITLQVTIPYNCSMSITKDNCNPNNGVSISNVYPTSWTINRSDNTTKSVTVTGLYMGYASSSVACIMASLTFTITVNDGNSEYRIGSSASLNRNVIIN